MVLGIMVMSGRGLVAAVMTWKGEGQLALHRQSPRRKELKWTLILDCQLLPTPQGRIGTCADCAMYVCVCRYYGTKKQAARKEQKTMDASQKVLCRKMCVVCV